MFGLEDQQKKKKNDEFVFELEDEFKNGKKRRDIKARVDRRIQQIKQVLRSGENKEEFDKFGVLLHGYTSILKVMSRFAPR